MQLIFENKSKEMDFDGTVITLLRSLKVMREEVVIKINGKLAPETAKIKSGDCVEIIKVVFGG